MAFLDGLKNAGSTIFGPGTDAPSYEALKRKRDIADALMQRSLGQQPQNWGEGVGSLMNAIAYRLMDRKLAPQEDAAKQQAMQELMQIKGGMGPQGMTPDQFQGLSGVAENPYAGVSGALAKSLMRRQMTDINGNPVELDPNAPMMQFAEGYPDSGGNFGWTDPGEIPPEEGGREPMDDPYMPPPDGPMSGAGGPVTRYSPKGTEVAGDIKLTEGQSKDLGFWNRMDGVNAEIDKFASELTDPGQRMRGAIPLVGNALVSEGFQRGRRAGQEWLWGLLRKDTGAAITEQEYNLYGPTYLPQYGDRPEMLKDKAAARQRAMDGIKKGLGIAEILADELKVQREQASPATGGGEDGDWRTQDPSTWTDEQLKEYVGG